MERPAIWRSRETPLHGDAGEHGSGDERFATTGYSDLTIRHRVQEWAEAGLTVQLHTLVLARYDRLIRLDLLHACVNDCITKAPRGGQMAA